MVAEVCSVRESEAKDATQMLERHGLAFCAQQGCPTRWKATLEGRRVANLVPKTQAREENRQAQKQARKDKARAQQRQWQEDVYAVQSFLRNSDTSFTIAELRSEVGMKFARCEAILKFLKKAGKVKRAYWKSGKCMVWMTLLVTEMNEVSEVATTTRIVSETEEPVLPPSEPEAVESPSEPVLLDVSMPAYHASLPELELQSPPPPHPPHRHLSPASTRSSISTSSWSSSSSLTSTTSLTMSTMTNTQRTLLSALIKQPLSSHAVLAHLCGMKETEARRGLRVLNGAGLVTCKQNPARWTATHKAQRFMATGLSWEEEQSVVAQKKQAKQRQQAQWEADVDAVFLFLQTNATKSYTETGLNDEFGLAHARCRAILHSLRREGDVERIYWPERKRMVWMVHERHITTNAVCAY